MLLWDQYMKCFLLLYINHNARFSVCGYCLRAELSFDNIFNNNNNNYNNKNFVIKTDDKKHNVLTSPRLFSSEVKKTYKLEKLLAYFNHPVIFPFFFCFFY